MNKLGTTHSVAGGTFINFSAAFNTARSLRDFEFLQSNREYDMLVGTVDFNEKEFNWMDFFMSEKKKITLFTKGAEAARDFLIKFDWNKYKALRKEMVFENTVKQIVGFSNKNDAISKFGLNKTSLADRFVKIMYPYITRWPINQEYKDMMEKLLKDIKEDISIVEKYVEKSGKAIHILWVDDDADSDIIERSILRLFDIECVVVADTDSATKKLQKENIEDIWLVVSDCYRSNGQTESLRLCRLMAYDESLIQVPVIFHSNSEASDIPESQLQNEIQSFINNNPLAAAFVRKNFSNLQDLIKEILEEISDKIKREGLLK